MITTSKLYDTANRYIETSTKTKSYMKGNEVQSYSTKNGIPQNTYGYVAVKKDGLWGSLNKEGKVVIEPTYDLNKNLLVDFIGKWHLGQDLNMNYYCDK